MGRADQNQSAFKYRILVAEDSDDDFELFRYHMKQMQEEGEFYFERVVSLKDLHKKINETKYDLILLDLFLQDTDHVDQSIECIQAIQVPVVVMTGLNDGQVGENLVQHGAQDYLVKDDINTQILRKTLYYSIERHQALERFIKNEKKYGLLFKQSSDAIVLLSPDGKVMEVNDQFEHMTGFGEKDLLKRSFKDLIEFENSDLDFLEILKDVEEYENKSLTGRFTFKNKKHMFAEFIFSEVDIQDNTLIQAIVRNVTERRQLEELKDAFLSAVSHEMRTPLAIINGAIFNMIEGVAGEANEGQMKLLQMASSNVNRLNKIINNLFDLSKLESTRRSQIYTEKMDLSDLFAKLIKRFDEEAKSKGIEIELKIDSELGVLYADTDKIEDMLMNLMSNSIRFAKSKITIHVDKVRLNSNLLSDNLANQSFNNLDDLDNEYETKISFYNDGSALSKIECKQLFDKFVQIKRPFGGAGYKGTGLGLAICKEIVGLHMGEIWAESDGKQGVTTIVTLPQKAEAVNEAKEIFESLISVYNEQTPFLFVLNIQKQNDGQQSLDENLITSFVERTSRQIEKRLLLTDDKIISRASDKQLIFVKHQSNKDFNDFLHELHGVCRDIWPKGFAFKVGVATYPSNGSSLEDLITAAKMKMIDLRGKPKLLMIDDDQDFIELMTLYLQTKNYSIDLAFNGKSGLEKAKETAPDLILIDRIMPGMDGLTVIHKLRNNSKTKSIPILVVTGYSDTQFNNELRKYKNIEVVSKPVDPRDLVNIIQKLYHKSHLPDIKSGQVILDNRSS